MSTATAAPPVKSVTVRTAQKILLQFEQGLDGTHYDHDQLKISFRHPGYKSPYDLLLKLSAFDHPLGGLHHRTALVACGIVAGNVWNGYFTETRDGPRITLDDDQLLTGAEYYFHVPSPSVEGSAIDEGSLVSPYYRYPVVPNFQEWPFPHHNLPPGWADGLMKPSAGSSVIRAPSHHAITVLERDGSCRISDYTEGLSCAHLCPQAELEWFTSNAMYEYNAQTQLSAASVTDDKQNCLTLRLDLHSTFDRRKFVFVPKGGALVTHFLQPTSCYGRIYHNTTTHPILNVSIEFFLARLAWAILPSIRMFLEPGIERLLIRLEDIKGEREYTHKRTTGVDCRKLSGLSVGPRGVSPKKRKPPGEGKEGNDDDELSYFLPESKRGRISSVDYFSSSPGSSGSEVMSDLDDGAGRRPGGGNAGTGQESFRAQGDQAELVQFPQKSSL
ncbi:hypothetical protein FGG08_004151 [Glutinoglossum americanum]|uniref:HNH nuclease domain-containing protein n=1 Tax=Glutinoglossum americanum TaxID=1670608 RepID=A0A9P8KXE3_9PEZI|nr:hypothetical protein FGG08_004151 [Glutinoglossum americanum]